MLRPSTIEAAYDRWQIRRVREAYTSVSGFVSPAPGLLGMTEEMRWGLQHLSAAERQRADDRVLRAIFFGTPGLAVLRWGFARHPTTTARLMSRLSPYALRFLVGEVRVGPGFGDNELPACAFRRTGGEQVCQSVCRQPTQDFAARHGIVVMLDPQPQRPTCRWTWGQGR